VTFFTLVIFMVGTWALLHYNGEALRKDSERLLGVQQFSTVSVVAAQLSEQLQSRLDAINQVANQAGPEMAAGATAMQAHLQHRPVLASLFNGGVLAYRMDGTAIAEVPLSAGRVGANYLDVEVVATALKEGKSTIGQPLVGKKLQRAVFGMAAPIRDARGTVIGALAGVVDLTAPNFLDRIAQSNYGQSGGYMVVAPQSRMVVTATDRHRALEMLGASALADSFIQGFEGSIVGYDAKGVEVLASARGIAATGWFIAAALPTAEAFAPLRDMAQRLRLTTLLLAALAGALILWMLHRQMAPMQAAAQALNLQVTKGLPLQPLVVRRQDEIGELIGGFNRALFSLGQREAALRDSEVRFRALYEQSNDAIFLMDAHGIVECNEQAANLFGYSRQEVVRLSPLALCPVQQPDGRLSADLIAEKVNSAMAGDCSHFELRTVRSDGAPLDVDVSLSRVDAGGVTFRQGVVRDISERIATRVAELAQKHSEKFLESITNKLPAMVAYWSRELRCLYANSAYLEWFGRTPSQMQAISMKELMGEDLFKRNEPYVLAVLGGKDQQFERQLVKPNGETCLVLAQYIADHEEAAVNGFFVLVIDITATKRSEEASRIAAVAFESQEGIVVMDADRKILKVNRAFTVLSGFAEQDLIGKNAARFRSAHHAPEFYAQIWSEAARTGAWQGDMWTQRPNGDELLARVTVSSVCNEFGQITHYVSSFSDVTGVRKTEQKRLIDEAAHRNLLVREVHHRIKNNLQGITGLLRQLSQNNPALASEVEKTMSQVHSISLVHGLQGRDISAAIHLGDLIAAIARDIGGLWQTTVSLSNLPELQQRTVAENEGVPIALVLNELVLNAVKHGGKAAGGVSITLQCVPKQDAVQVKISNPGLLAADRSHNGKSHSGLQLVAALMPQVGATLTLRQEGEQVVAMLELAPPIIEAAPKETT
jgi:PAS domain S-box-containing protein